MHSRVLGGGGGWNKWGRVGNSSVFRKHKNLRSLSNAMSSFLKPWGHGAKFLCACNGQCNIAALHAPDHVAVEPCVKHFVQISCFSFSGIVV